MEVTCLAHACGSRKPGFSVAHAVALVARMPCDPPACLPVEAGAGLGAVAQDNILPRGPEDESLPAAKGYDYKAAEGSGVLGLLFPSGSLRRLHGLSLTWSAGSLSPH